MSKQGMKIFSILAVLIVALCAIGAVNAAEVTPAVTSNVTGDAVITSDQVSNDVPVLDEDTVKGSSSGEDVSIISEGDVPKTTTEYNDGVSTASPNVKVNGVLQTLTSTSDNYDANKVVGTINAYNNMNTTNSTGNIVLI